LSEGAGLEFTGERVVPGLVDADLLNEHLARYRFAARFVAHFTEPASVLDAGCGSGYGVAELGAAAAVIGVDASVEAIDYARGNFSRPGVHFLPAVCEALPFADESFDLVLAFEVIEHLKRWEDFLAEARRVLRPAGVLLVSTPNKSYYAEARGAAGPNPFHVREFDYAEFEGALRQVFPHVKLWTQNHSDAIVFNSAKLSAGDFDTGGDLNPEHAHFFFAACSQAPIGGSRAFAWSPAAGNALREREHHIALLESEIAQKDSWLAQVQAAHAALNADHEKLLAELQESNVWAEQLNAQLAQAGQAIAALQLELATTHAGYREKVLDLEAEMAVRLEWVHRVEDELAERTRWGQSLEADLAQAKAQLRLAANSKWVRVGRQLHLGPEIVIGDGPPE
jgi:O-antigen biosynthesis protein